MHQEVCPHCGMPMNNLDRMGRHKHITACARKGWRYKHTGRPPGRPRKHFPIRTPEKGGRDDDTL